MTVVTRYDPFLSTDDEKGAIFRYRGHGGQNFLYFRTLLVTPDIMTPELHCDQVRQNSMETGHPPLKNHLTPFL
jgi:hypothetical protein